MVELHKPIFLSAAQSEHVPAKTHGSNCRITEWFTFGESLVQPRCSKQNQLEQVAQDLVRLHFKYLQRWRLLNLSGHPVLVSDHPHGKSEWENPRGRIASLELLTALLLTEPTTTILPQGHIVGSCLIGVHQDLQVLFCKTAFLPLGLQCVVVSGVTPL